MLTVIVAIVSFISIAFILMCVKGWNNKSKYTQEIKKGDIYQTALFPENPFTKMENLEVIDIKGDWVKCKYTDSKRERSMRISYLEANYTLKEEKE